MLRGHLRPEFAELAVSGAKAPSHFLHCSPLLEVVYPGGRRIKHPRPPPFARRIARHQFYPRRLAAGIHGVGPRQRRSESADRGVGRVTHACGRDVSPLHQNYGDNQASVLVPPVSRWRRLSTPARRRGIRATTLQTHLCIRLPMAFHRSPSRHPVEAAVAANALHCICNVCHDQIRVKAIAWGNVARSLIQCETRVYENRPTTGVGPLSRCRSVLASNLKAAGAW